MGAPQTAGEDPPRESWTVELVSREDREPIRFPCAADTTINDAARAYGVALDVVCANAGCGVCRAELLAGLVEYQRPVSQKQRTGPGPGYELTCAAVPRSDLVLRPLRGWRRVFTSPLSRLTRSHPAGHGSG